MSAIEDDSLRGVTVYLVGIGLGLVVEDKQRHAVLVLCKLLLPGLVLGAVNTCVIGLGLVVEHILKEFHMLVVGFLIVGVLEISFNDILILCSGSGKLGSVFESVVEIKKVGEHILESVDVKSQMADLEEDHISAVKGVDEVRLDNNAAHELDVTVSDLIYKLILLLFGSEGIFGNVLYLFGVVIIEILHQLALLFEELDSERVISLNQKLVRLVERIVIYLFGDRHRGEDIYNSLKE